MYGCAGKSKVSTGVSTVRGFRGLRTLPWGARGWGGDWIEPKETLEIFQFKSVHFIDTETEIQRHEAQMITQ